MQTLNPLAIQDIAFAPADILHLPGIDQQHLETHPLQDLENGNPIHPGGFHSHAAHFGFLEPIPQCFQFGSGGPKTPDRLPAPARRNRRPVLSRTHINPRRVRIDQLPILVNRYFLFAVLLCF